MRRLRTSLLILVVLVALSLAVPAGADRVVSEIPVPGSLVWSGNTPEALAMLPNGDLAFAWIDTAKQIHVGWRRLGHWSLRTIGRVQSKRVYGELQYGDFAIALDGNRGLVVVWSDARGLWADSWSDRSPQFIAAGKKGSVSLIHTDDGQLLAFCVSGGTRRGELGVYVQRGRSWSVIERTPAVLYWDIHGSVAATPWGRSGYALLFNGGSGRLTIETHTAPGTRGARYQLPAKQGLGFIADVSDESLGVLYGGQRIKGRAVDLRFSLLRNGRLHSRMLIPDLQCSIGAIGIGHVGNQIRLAYGYGCGTGWTLNTVGGKATYDAGNRDVQDTFKQRIASAGGRVASIGLDLTNQLTIRIVGPGRQSRSGRK
jgi:hypothetical protein